MTKQVKVILTRISQSNDYWHDTDELEDDVFLNLNCQTQTNELAKKTEILRISGTHSVIIQGEGMPNKKANIEGPFYCIVSLGSSKVQEQINLSLCKGHFSISIVAYFLKNALGQLVIPTCQLQKAISLVEWFNPATIQVLLMSIRHLKVCRRYSVIMVLLDLLMICLFWELSDLNLRFPFRPAFLDIRFELLDKLSNL
ncbi:hypothetical protein BDA99DRAFT_538286 [Phascolomyces articulosus]|uniref:Uncharacterized protein n=1 Tax=Phascolomyces articulosus TaxID=60185 RepID=A0AAD5PDG4_9FUNG|nr:hypothetical protein BDA99DRAFT_538286 [Phascolomyces articulosus]